MWGEANVQPCEIAEVVLYAVLHPFYCSFTTPSQGGEKQGDFRVTGGKT